MTNPKASQPVIGAAAVHDLAKRCAVLHCVAAHIAVLGTDGTILFTNEAWDRFARENGNPSLASVAGGANYLGVCARAVLDGAAGAQACLSGIKDVLERKADWFSIQYPCHSAAEKRWFNVEVTPMDGPAGAAAVVSHVDVTRDKVADIDEALRRHQQEIKVLLDNVPDLVVRMDREGRYAYVNVTAARMIGLAQPELLGRTPRQLGLPDILCEHWVTTFRQIVDSGGTRIAEIHYPFQPGTTWEERAVAEFAVDGSVQSMLIIARDITDRKNMEKATRAHAAEIRALVARLLIAEEDERRRIARDLHDNLLQQLALIAIETDGLIADVALPEAARRRLRAIRARAVQVSDETRTLSYKLHPAILDSMGLEVALKDLRDEFAAKHSIAVKFNHPRKTLEMPKDVASCLYRVAQESLSNVARHAHARNVTLKLLHLEHELHLSVEDDGVGFDPRAARGKGHLGLLSMEERVSLIGGRISLEAMPGGGTRVAVSVALPKA